LQATLIIAISKLSLLYRDVSNLCCLLLLFCLLHRNRAVKCTRT